MNKYLYTRTDGTTPKPTDPPSGWGFSDAVTHASCPKCNCTFGYHCETPKGRQAWPPHTERQRAAYDAGVKPKEVKAYTVQEVLAKVLAK